MKKQRRKLFFILAVGCIVFISVIMCVKGLAITDDSEQVYTYEETSLGNEIDIATENYTPTEK